MVYQPYDIYFLSLSLPQRRSSLALVFFLGLVYYHIPHMSIYINSTQAVKDVNASYEALVKLLERIQFSFNVFIITHQSHSRRR